MERPTFSQSWSRVSRLTPVLRPQVEVHRQLYRGEPWYVLHDPITNDFFRVNTVAYHFIGLLDGKRSVEQAWDLTLDRHGDAAPTQNEVIGLLGQLNQSNLLRVDLPADAEPLLKRNRKRRFKQVSGQLMSIMALKIPVFNPDRLLTIITPMFRPILNRTGMVLWVALLAYALFVFLPHIGTFATDAGSVLAPTNWGWMVLIFLLIKAWHELGHGVICKGLGGHVPETGIMFLVLFPMPYVNATSSWNFPEKWKRILVSAAGMIFELAVAAVAAILWVHAEPGSLLKQLTYNLVFLASVTTILFNSNPLLRFDGYYMLADFLEIPNLYQRASKHIQWLFQRYAFGMENAQPVSTSLGEQVWLVVYGIASQIYKVLIMFSIALFVAGAIPTLGILIALWTVTAWAVIPAGKFVHWLWTSPALFKKRPRAVAATFAMAAVVVVALGVVPMNDHRRAIGVVESRQRTDIAIQADGIVREVLVETGDAVEAGQVLLRAYNPDLESARAQIQAKLRSQQVALRAAVNEEPVLRRITQSQIDTLREQLRDVDQKLEKLTLRAPHAGRLAGPSLAPLIGQHLTQGQVVAQVADLGDLHVTAMVDQVDNAAAFADGIAAIELRTAGQLGTPHPTELLKAHEGGYRTLPHQAVGYAGGGPIATDPEDSTGMTAARPQFKFDLRLPVEGEQARPIGLPGERVYVRFTLNTKRPLLFQWVHSLRQVIRDRLAV